MMSFLCSNHFVTESNERDLKIWKIENEAQTCNNQNVLVLMPTIFSPLKNMCKNFFVNICFEPSSLLMSCFICRHNNPAGASAAVARLFSVEKILSNLGRVSLIIPLLQHFAFSPVNYRPQSAIGLNLGHKWPLYLCKQIRGSRLQTMFASPQSMFTPLIRVNPLWTATLNRFCLGWTIVCCQLLPVFEPNWGGIWRVLQGVHGCVDVAGHSWHN